MDQLFLIQLLSSFSLGGLIVALQAWLAQKVPHKISGLIISAPSTIVVNFFFLGLVLTQDEFSKVLPMIPAPLGISFVLIISYIISANFFSKLIKSKLLSIVISFSISLLIWFLSAFPLVTLRGLDLSLSMIIYVSLVLLFQFFITQLQVPNVVIDKISVTNFQILSRAIFSGLMVTLTVFFAKISGPNIGALLSMFPTAYLCLLIIIHYSSGPKCLSNYFANSALGSLSLIVYANCAHYFFPKYGILLGSTLCFILSAFSSFLLVKFESKFKIFGNNTSTRS